MKKLKALGGKGIMNSDEGFDRRGGVSLRIYAFIILETSIDIR